MRVLYLEPDPLARQHLEPELIRRGLAVEWAAGERAAFECLAAGEFDALITDSDPADGFDFVALLRAAGVDTPAISMLSGEIGDGQRPADPHGFARPFSLDELVLRIRRVARLRQTEPPDGCLRVHDLELDLRVLYAERAGVVLDLSSCELAVLEYLMRNVGRVLTQSMIAENALRDGQRPAAAEVEVHLERLCWKIDRGFDTPLLHMDAGGIVLEHRSSIPRGVTLPSSA